jgi:D-alanyl-D-alanine carboxypeptidase
MMTALVVADLAGFDEQVTISVTAPEAGEAEVGLVAGEVFTVGELLSVMLVRSANDAALALAEYVGGSVEGFTDLMNQKAAEMGMRNSHFANPHGLDVEGHYTSAADELTMARAILANPQLAAMVRLTQISFPPAPDGTQRGGIATNRLLDRYPGVIDQREPRGISPMRRRSSTMDSIGPGFQPWRWPTTPRWRQRPVWRR